MKQVGFIDKGTGKHQSNAVYSQEDLSPTIYASVEKEPIKSLEIGTTHYPHGWLKENADFSGNCPTIDSGIWKHHTLLIEKGKYE